MHLYQRKTCKEIVVRRYTIKKGFGLKRLINEFSWRKRSNIVVIDYLFLAKQFELSGGNIRNIVLESTFLAANRDHQIGMLEILQALARHQIKQGKVPSSTDFKQYYQLAINH